MGVFFVQVYTVRRREIEYLLFGLVCLSVAVTDAGFALSGASSGADRWVTAQRLTHVGALLATALNFHFVLQFVGAA